MPSPQLFDLIPFLVEIFSPLNKPLADRGKGEKMKTKSIKKAPLS
jgi:hypothetical protein